MSNNAEIADVLHRGCFYPAKIIKKWHKGADPFVPFLANKAIKVGLLLHQELGAGYQLSVHRSEEP